MRTAAGPVVLCARQARPGAARRALRVRAGSVPGALRVLITGSTKGLGRALADAFLAGGETRVLVNSRSAERVAEVVTQLQATHGTARVRGFAADVSVPDDVDALTQYARDELGGVDVWINNAGSNGYVYAPLTETPPSALPSGGLVFNMEGAGSDGSPTRKYVAYGATKAALPQLLTSLRAEWAGTRVNICNMSPGMVYTDLLSCGAGAFGAVGDFFVNSFAEPADVAAAILVPQVMAEYARVQAGGAPSRKVEVLTPLVAVQKLGRRVLFGENKSRWVPEL